MTAGFCPAERSMMDDITEMLDELLPEGWEHDAGTYGSSFTLTCPHGETIEQDGRCPEGCESPLLTLGLI